MSNTNSWLNRMEKHRYSQDDRTLSYKYQKEIEPKIDLFLNDFKISQLNLGPFNLNLEPWRLISIIEFRKYGLKITESVDLNDKNLTLITLSKLNLSRTNLGK